jgi:hypothetical protein
MARVLRQKTAFHRIRKWQQGDRDLGTHDSQPLGSVALHGFIAKRPATEGSEVDRRVSGVIGPWSQIARKMLFQIKHCLIIDLGAFAVYLNS